MFQIMFRRAQAAVETTIDQAINRALLMVPFLVAAGFGTAALAYRLNRQFGPETANLIMAGLFVGIGLIAALFSAVRSTPGVPAVEEAAKIADDPKSVPPAPPAELSEADREMMMAAVGTLAPIATPILMRMVIKNLPLLAVLIAGIFVVTRDTGRDTASGSDRVAI